MVPASRCLGDGWIQIVLGSLIRPDPHTYIPNTFWQVLEQDLEAACCERLLHRKGLQIRHFEYDQPDQNCGHHLRLNLQSVEFCIVSHQCSKTLLLLYVEQQGPAGVRFTLCLVQVPIRDCHLLEMQRSEVGMFVRCIEVTC